MTSTSRRRLARPLAPFARFAWGFLAYNVAVIAWGAFVRATGSGAGCGRHWPMCNGEVVPRSPRVETLIELTHRVTSGVAIAGTLVLLGWALRAYPPRHRVRAGAWTATGLMAAEAAIGAALVLFELVAHEASMKRALSMSVHLLNTFCLLASLAATAWWASGGRAPRLHRQRAVIAVLATLMASVLAVGASGAIAALGDTLFPVRSLADGIAQDFTPGAHIFLRLRAIHPVLAAVTAFAVVMGMSFVRAARPTAAVRGFSRAASALAALQVAVGLGDVLSRAPVAMQLVHLTVATLVWIALALTAVAALAEAPAADVEATGALTART